MEPDINALLTDAQCTELTQAAKATLAAAQDDFNDKEIQALQDFRDLGLEIFGIEVDND